MRENEPKNRIVSLIRSVYLEVFLFLFFFFLFFLFVFLSMGGKMNNDLAG